MDYKRLGSTGLKVTRVCIGTMTFGLQSDEQQAHAILDRAAESGVRFVDTANVYPLGGGLETNGRTEEIVGSWLKGKRDQFILATKFNGPMGPEPFQRGGSRKHILDAIDQSLRRLQTDYVDLYQMHAVDDSTPIEETLEALDSVVRSGKARYVGCSNFLAYRVALALGKSQAAAITKFVSVQPRYNLVFREMERELFPLCGEEGLGVLAYNPLAGGVLTGKHDSSSPPPSGRFSEDLLSQSAKNYKGRYWHNEHFSTVEEIRSVAKEAGVSMTTLAVSWVLANPAVTSAILGASRPEQLEESLAGGEYSLDPEIKRRLDEITAEFRKGDAIR